MDKELWLRATKLYKSEVFLSGYNSLLITPFELLWKLRIYINPPHYNNFIVNLAIYTLFYFVMCFILFPFFDSLGNINEQIVKAFQISISIGALSSIMFLVAKRTKIVPEWEYFLKRAE